MTSTYTSPLIPLEDSSEEFAVDYSSDKYGTDEIGFRHDQQTYRRKSSVAVTKRSLACYGIAITVLVCLFGVLIGRYAFRVPQSDKSIKPVAVGYDSYQHVRDIVFKEMKAANINNNLKDLTKIPHIAGSPNDETKLVKYITDKYKQWLDKVEVFPYNVLLSYPNISDPNYAALTYPNGTILFKTNWTEKPQTEFEKQPGVAPAFNAYAPAGHAVGHMFYVNYGSYEDFEYLAKVGINVTGGICIARYGKISRGNKASLATAYKCAGLIMYTDPYDFGGMEKHSWNPSIGNKNGYPNKWWMPPSGVQRGTISGNGDPLTPGYPSLNFTYRIPEANGTFPKIPVQPISYEDAYNFLLLLGGKDAPESEWQGGFNFTYKLGGSFNAEHKFCKVKLHVGNYHARKTVHTIIGYIKGWQEPDRYVLLGNHRDAWTFGGADPSSGTAAVLEAARALSTVVKKGIWRPRRTIVFCNWGAEEYWLVGSTEWVEQMEKKLILRAVSYINIDIPVEGNDTFRLKAMPTLYDLMYNVTAEVPNPDAKEIEKNRSTVYDTWLAKNFDFHDHKKPFIANIGSGSDYTMFIQKAGVACADLRYTFTDHHLSSYPVYHSVHDTYEYVHKFLDPDFNVTLAISRIAVGGLLKLSDSLVLPMKPVDYAKKLAELTDTLQKNNGAKLLEHNISLDEMRRVIEVFDQSAVALLQKANALNTSSDPLYIRQINDKLFTINRAFLDFNGIPGQQIYRHVIFAPSSHNSYSGAGYPTISDAIFNAERGASWELVKQQISVVCCQILAAAGLMDEL